MTPFAFSDNNAFRAVPLHSLSKRRTALDKGNPIKDPIRTQEQEGVRIHYPRLNQRPFCVSKFMSELSLSMKTLFKADQLEESKKYAAIKLVSNAPNKGVVKTLTLITGKDEVHQQKLSAAAALAEHLGMEFPQQGLPVVVDDGEPVAVHAEDLVGPNSFFLTDYSGQMITVQPMMDG